MERNGELGQDSRKRRNEVGVGANVGRELWTAESNSTPHDASFHAQPVRNECISALRYEPESAVLADKDGRQEAGDRSVEHFDGRFYRLRWLGNLGGGGGRLVRCGGEQPSVDGRRDAGRRRRRLHREDVGLLDLLLE